MYQDALVSADQKYDFLSCLNDPKKYLPLTDMITNRISNSTDPCLAKSRAILDRIQTRNLYQFVEGFYLESWKWKDAFKVQDVVDHGDGEIQAEDVILLPTKYDYGCGNNFPTDLVSFYGKDK